MQTTQPQSKLDKLSKMALECACFNIRKASRAISQLYDDILAPTGLRSTQFSLLVAISFVGKEGIGALSKVLVTDRTTLTRNIQHLLDKGLVEKVPHGDRRMKAYAITEGGLRVFEEAYPYWEEAQAKVIDKVGPNGLKALSALVADVVEIGHPA